MRIALRGVAYAFLFVLLIALPGRGQEHRASIRGVVIDPSGHRLHDVEVRVTNEQTRETRRVRTDRGGRFTVAEVPPGVYRVTVEHAGFGRFIARADLAMNQDYWFSVPLQAGDMIQAVEGIAPFLPSDHDSPAVHTLIDARDLNEWPIETGNFLELARLAPGVVVAPQGSISSRRGGFAVNVNGAREDSNGFLLDGVSTVDPRSNVPAVRTPSDAIRQFQVFTSTYDASFGRNGGGQISAITKSGANTFSGSLYGFVRGTALGGRNHFAPKDEPAPEYGRNQAGVTLGGPLAKNHTFFFLDYERTHVREGITRVTNVPTLAERSGDFSQSLFNRPIDYLTGQRFAGDVIPAGRLSAIGRAIATLYPAPNRTSPFANVVSSPVLRDDIDQADARIDQSLGGGARLTARYSYTDRRLFEPFAGRGLALVPGFGTRVPTRGQNAALGITHGTSSRTVNDLRVGYTRSSVGVFAGDTSAANTSVGLGTFTSDPRDAGLSLVTVSGYSPLGHDSETPQDITIDALQASDTVSFTLGPDLLRIGVQWDGARERGYRDVQARGFLAFSDRGYTGNALADLLLGLPVLSGGARFDNPRNLRTNTAGVFVQNDWRPFSALTFSVGVRYGYTTPPVDAANRANLYDPAARQVVRVGTAGMPRGGYVADRNNIAPRAGFAWTIGQEGMNVIRGGYGVYYDRPTLAASEALFLDELPNYTLAVLSPAFPPASAVFIPPSVAGYQRDLRTPRMEQWNLNVQHQMGLTSSVELGYVGSRGRDLLAARDLNQPTAGASLVHFRPNPLFADITFIESRATSDYNAVQLRFQRRSAIGTSVLTSYTIGKSMDDASGLSASAGDPNFPQNSSAPQAERARSSFDVRHRFSIALTRPLPFNPGQALGKLGIVSRALADTDLTAVAVFQSGRPFTVTLLPDAGYANTGRAALGFGSSDRPNVSGRTALPRGTESAWFNTSAFSLPASGTFGDSGRNTQTGPGYKNVNLALVKHVRLGRRDRTTIDLRLDVFNLLSTVNYDLPDAFFGSPTFGRILSAGSPRRVQFGVKAIF